MIGWIDGIEDMRGPAEPDMDEFAQAPHRVHLTFSDFCALHPEMVWSPE